FAALADARVAAAARAPHLESVGTVRGVIGAEHAFQRDHAALGGRPDFATRRFLQGGGGGGCPARPEKQGEQAGKRLIEYRKHDSSPCAFGRKWPGGVQGPSRPVKFRHVGRQGQDWTKAATLPAPA